MRKSTISGATIPYQLRPRKAIERNIFIDLLKKLDSNEINLQDYRYVGFGAAYLEDFKQMHLQLGITNMDCIEMDENAFSRQIFNNPYHFIKSYNVESTSYIDHDIQSDRNQIFWLDYAIPRDLHQQLTDVENLCAKLMANDIVKFTFNARIGSFISSHQIKNGNGYLIRETESKVILNYLKKHPTYEKYIPEKVTVRDILNFDSVIRAMAIRAVKRGLAKASADLKFHHLSSFRYADGQEMTTIAGIVGTDDNFSKIYEGCKLKDWPFYLAEDTNSEFFESHEIAVPDMTISERLEIDKKIPTEDIDSVAKDLIFKYGADLNEHIHLVKGYHKFYKYLPYFSKIIY